MNRGASFNHPAGDERAPHTLTGPSPRADELGVRAVTLARTSCCRRAKCFPLEIPRFPVHFHTLVKFLDGRFYGLLRLVVTIVISRLGIIESQIYQSSFTSSRIYENCYFYVVILLVNTWYGYVRLSSIRLLSELHSEFLIFHSL